MPMIEAASRTTVIRVTMVVLTHLLNLPTWRFCQVTTVGSGPFFTLNHFPLKLYLEISDYNTLLFVVMSI